MKKAIVVGKIPLRVLKERTKRKERPLKVPFGKILKEALSLKKEMRSNERRLIRSN